MSLTCIFLYKNLRIYLHILYLGTILTLRSERTHTRGARAVCAAHSDTSLSSVHINSIDVRIQWRS